MRRSVYPGNIRNDPARVHSLQCSYPLAIAGNRPHHRRPGSGQFSFRGVLYRPKPRKRRVLASLKVEDGKPVKRDGMYAYTVFRRTRMLNWPMTSLLGARAILRSAPKGIAALAVLCLCLPSAVGAPPPQREAAG